MSPSIASGGAQVALNKSKMHCFTARMGRDGFRTIYCPEANIRAGRGEAQYQAWPVDHLRKIYLKSDDGQLVPLIRLRS